MSLINTGLQDVRDFLFTRLATMQLGTSGVAIAYTQTGLQAPVSATSSSVSNIKGALSLTSQMTLYSTSGTGVTYRESCVFTQSGTGYSRSVFPGYLHDGTQDLIVTETFYVVQQ